MSKTAAVENGQPVQEQIQWVAVPIDDLIAVQTFLNRAILDGHEAQGLLARLNQHAQPATLAAD